MVVLKNSTTTHLIIFLTFFKIIYCFLPNREAALYTLYFKVPLLAALTIAWLAYM